MTGVKTGFVSQSFLGQTNLTWGTSVVAGGRRGYFHSQRQQIQPMKCVYVNWNITENIFDNQFQIGGYTPLYLAACGGYASTCSTLLSLGADVNHRPRVSIFRLCWHFQQSSSSPSLARVHLGCSFASLSLSLSLCPCPFSFLVFLKGRVISGKMHSQDGSMLYTYT